MKKYILFFLLFFGLYNISSASWTIENIEYYNMNGMVTKCDGYSPFVGNPAWTYTTNESLMNFYCGINTISDLVFIGTIPGAQNTNYQGLILYLNGNMNNGSITNFIVSDNSVISNISINQYGQIIFDWITGNNTNIDLSINGIDNNGNSFYITKNIILNNTNINNPVTDIANQVGNGATDESVNIINGPIGYIIMFILAISIIGVVIYAIRKWF